MGWLHGSLGNRVRNQEEVEGAVDHFGLLDESVVDIGPLWRVSNGSIGALSLLLEESLPDSFVDDDESVLWLWLVFVLVKPVLLLDNFLKLVQLMVNDLLSH